MKEIIMELARGHSLLGVQARKVFSTILQGKASEAEMAAILIALRMRGEKALEVIEGAEVMREMAKKVTAPEGAIDIVGTGGDGRDSLNISTAAAFIVAGAGVVVAKHGNRAFSSKTGSADLLEALGVNLDAPFDKLEQAMREASIAFLMAPRHHEAVRYVAPVRKALGVRTIFNLLGPLCNPAGVDCYLLGVGDKKHLNLMAEALSGLAVRHAWVVHSSDGFDELSPAGTNFVIEVKGEERRSFELTPEEAGIPRSASEELKGGTAQENAAALQALLAGAPSSFRNAALLNAAAAILIAGAAPDLRTGADMAKDSLDSGKAAQSLEKLIAITG